VISKDRINLSADQTLEDVINECDDDSYFPDIYQMRGLKTYSKRYQDFKKSLEPYQGKVEMGALEDSIQKWFERAKKSIKTLESNKKKAARFTDLLHRDPIIHLNNHGPEHIQRVIQKVSDIIRYFHQGYLSYYEGFLLLCAIQVHDLGNYFGREDHEKKCSTFMDAKGKIHIPCGVERKIIQQLALVHSGAYNGNNDTIGQLSTNKTIYEKDIRIRLLAGLLRFGDELSDDKSRTDHEGLELNTIPEYSIIFHQYSKSLHTVRLCENEINKGLYIELNYEFDSNLAKETFRIYNDQRKYLLDEIYDRTLKMERERRYCMRFLRPYVSIDSIQVKVTIQNADDALKSDTITYTLKEDGYPADPKPGNIQLYEPDIRTGKQEIEYLNKEWGV
jgi:hypothetical protein